jgi:O-antigen ligase/polysaccharide polymerase Wzy-like membrane protein
VTAQAAMRRLPRASPIGLAGLFLALIPVAAALRLTGHGGGYTIDQWGIWAAVTVVAAGVALVGQPLSRLSGLQRLLPLSLLGLALWSLLSIRWAAWPQSALVEADRYLFYAAAVTLVLVALPASPGWRRLLVSAVAAAAALPALVVALKLWQSSSAASLFEAGRLVGSIGYGGGLAAAVAIGFWPLVALAGDRATPRPARPLAAVGAGLVLATVVPTEARASVWALVVSALVFFALCPTPIRSGAIAAGALLPTLALWHDLNGVFSSAGGGAPDAVGSSILLVGLVAGLVCGGQVLLDQVVTLPAAGRQAVAVGAAIWLVVMVMLGGVAVFAVTDGHPIGWARHTLQRTVDRVGTESGQAAAEGQAGSRFGSLDTGRYDLWKVAVRGFRARPAEGYGAGNFGYLNVRLGRPFLFPYQAHSQLLEVASTLGFPGIALFLVVLLLPFGACLWVRLRVASASEQLLAAGVGGSLGYFAVHGQVDWIWQISACALPALLLAAAVVGMLPPGRERRRSALLGGAAAAAAVAAAAVLIVPAALAQRYLERSYHEPAAAALRDADRARTLDRLSGRPDLAAARALLRTGDTAAALADARRAAGAEPDFWVAWQLLSVTAARQDQRASAVAAHARVRVLAPRLPLELRGEVPTPSFDHY